MATALSFWSDVAAAGGVRLADSASWTHLTWREAITQDRGGATFSVPISAPEAASVQIYNVVRIVDEDQAGTKTAWEYRISQFTDHATSPEVAVVCQPIIADLGKPMIQQLIGGMPTYKIAFTSLTPAQIIDAFILPAMGLAGYGYFVRGAVTPTSPLTLAFDHWTPLQLLAWLEQQTGYEGTLTRNGDVNFALNLWNTGASAPVAVAWVGRNVAALTRDVQGNKDFLTRVVPAGSVLSGESEPTNAGEAAYMITGVSGNVLTLADPEYRFPAVNFDGQYDGYYALRLIDPVVFPFAASAPSQFAYDPTRQLAWAQHNTSATGISWVSIVDGSSGQITNLASGGYYPVYASAHDRLYIGGASTLISIVDCTSNTYTGSVTTAAAINGSLTYIPELDRIFVPLSGPAYQILNPNTNTVNASTAVSGMGSDVDYDPVTNRICVPGTNLTLINGSTFAVATSLNPGTGWSAFQVLAVLPGGFVVCFNTGNGTYVVVNLAAPATQSPATLPLYNGETITVIGTQNNVPVINGVVYLQCTSSAGRRYILAASVNTTAKTLTWLGTPGDFGGTTIPNLCYDPTRDQIIYPAGHVASMVRMIARATLMPQEGFTVQSTAAAGATIDKAATDTGTYLTDPSPRIEFRQSSALERVGVVADQQAAATYGNVDGKLDITILGKRNYWRGAPFNEWRSGNQNRWLASPEPVVSTHGTHEQKWSVADVGGTSPTVAAVATPFAASATTIVITGLTPSFAFAVGDLIATGPTPSPTAAGIVASATSANASGIATVTLQANSLPAMIPGTMLYVLSQRRTATVSVAYSANALSISLSGLAPYAVLQPGDIIAAPGTASTVYGGVRIRTTADGSGNASVPISPYPSTLALNTVVAVYSPRSLRPLTNNCVAAPLDYVSTIAWQSLEASLPLPYLTSQTTAWAVAHLLIGGFGAAPSAISFNVRAPFASSSTSVSPSDATSHSDGAYREFWLAVQVPLAVAATGFVDAWLQGGGAQTVHLISLNVHYGATAITDHDISSDDSNVTAEVAALKLVAAAAPTLVYTVQALEDDPSAEFTLGGAVQLVDPNRGINTRTPRVVDLGYTGTRDVPRFRAPTVTLANQPNSTLEDILALQLGSAAGGLSAYSAPAPPAGQLASLSISPSPVTLAQGGTQTFTATGYDAYGNTVPITPAWAVVSGGGTITTGGVFTAGIVAGTYGNTVQVTAGGLTAYATVTVSVGTAVSLTVSPAAVSMPVSATQQFTAIAKDSNGNLVSVTPAWSVVAGGGSIGSSSGLFTAGATAGTYTNTVKATVGALTATATVTLLSGVGVLARITVSPASPSLTPNGTQTMTAVGYDQYGTVVAITPVWTVVNGGGTISAGGVFTASTVAGTFSNTVKCTSGGVSGYATVVVTAGPLATITVTPNPASVPVGTSVTFTGQGYDAFGNPAFAPITWKVVSGIGYISNTGYFTASAAAGTYAKAIEASSGAVVGYATVTVTSSVVASIALSPSTAIVPKNGNQTFAATASDAYGNVVAATFSWSVVAGGGTIDSNGNFTAGATAGTYTNTIKVTSGSAVAYATVKVSN